MAKQSDLQAFRSTVDSPVGKLTVIVSAEGLQLLCFKEFEKDWAAQIEKLGAIKNVSADSAEMKATATQLKRYFAGDTSALDKIKTAPLGSAFQKNVWQKMRRVPAGKVTSYGELAKKAGSPKAARAVGTACRNNPLALVYPCHRIVASSGKLNAYRGGLKRKEFLLRHEGVSL